MLPAAKDVKKTCKIWKKEKQLTVTVSNRNSNSNINNNNKITHCLQLTN